MYGSNNVLLEGLTQALCLTKSIRVDGLPKPLQDLITTTLLPSSIDRNVQQIILASNLLDAEQVKLSRIKNPERPAYNYPRPYGISHQRRKQVFLGI